MSSGTGQRFSLSEIQYATKDFDDDLVIGKGGFGKVYKGQLSTDHVVAIKRLSSMSSQGEPEFKAEIETLSELRHCHLVSLIGYCDENKEMILVYEYMPNGTLYHHLHKSKTILDWVQRMKIAIGAGRGLDYLHSGVATDHGIIHRDVKSSNILLDKNLEAKISDFGLSKIGPTSQSSSWVDASVKGTFGYLDPEYFYTKKLSRKTDVYAFGVVLFELLSGRLAVDEHRGDEQCSLVRWAKKCVKERKFDQIVDSSIKGTIFPKGLRRFAQIADRCVHGIPNERPTMTEVVASLKAILELQLKFDDPAKPSGIMGFTWKTHKSLGALTIQNSGMDRFNFFPKDESSTSSSTNPGKEFTYDELKRVTRNFKGTCLWKGTDTEVYKGWVDKLTYSPCNKRSGLPVTVKVFHDYRKHSHFDKEIFKECSHPNLVKFIGYCINDEQLLLVYEFMCNGNLEDLLGSGAIARLPLVKKVQIAFGVVRGIHFLQKMHQYFGEYRDHEPLFGRRSIMLDEDFNAKFSDYGVTYISSSQSPPAISWEFDDYLEESDRRRRRQRQPQTDKMNFRVEGKLLPMELSGFTVIFEEVVSGRILNKSELDTIDDKWQATARLCYESCYGVESESKVLETLEEYAKYIPPRQEETSEDAAFYSATLEELEDDTFSTTSFESCL